jgi:hypothetical protein
VITNAQYLELRELCDHQLKFYGINSTTCVYTDYLDSLLKSFIKQKETIKNLREEIDND